MVSIVQNKLVARDVSLTAICGVEQQVINESRVFLQ